jgi:hypothetical protein
MKKNDMLPILAAFVIALLVFPTLALPVNALTPATGGNIGSVVTIPEDDLKRNTGVMVLGLLPTENWLYPPGEAPFDPAAPGWYEDSACTTPITTSMEDDDGYSYLPVGAELTSEYVVQDEDLVFFQKVSANLCEVHYFLQLWPEADKGYAAGMDLVSQHKILATLNGVPTKPDYFLCEVIEKEKAKIPPMTTKTPSTRQFDDEIIRTTVKDVTSNFICKVWWVKPGVGALDVYFVGPRVKNFIADHMLIITMGWKVGRTTVWASDLQDICILGWSMGQNTLKIFLFKNPGKSTWPAGKEYYYSWDDALYNFASCDEAAAWQRAWIDGGWPYAA